MGTGVYVSFWNLSAPVVQVKWLYAQECRFCAGGITEMFTVFFNLFLIGG